MELRRVKASLWIRLCLEGILWLIFYPDHSNCLRISNKAVSLSLHSCVTGLTLVTSFRSGCFAFTTCCLVQEAWFSAYLSFGQAILTELNHL